MPNFVSLAVWYPLCCLLLWCAESEAIHANYDYLHHSKDCREYIHQYNTSFDACAFIRNATVCQDSGIFNYNVFVYCYFTLSSRAAAVVIEFLILLVFFLALAITADNFFCPCLVVMAKTLHMSDNIAGVSLLAFGNGAPDLFSAIAAIKNMENGDAGLAIGALLGAAMFVTTLVVGTISVIHPFEAMKRPLLRDVVFLLGGVFFVFYILYMGRITFIESIGFLCSYVIYVLLVIVGRYIYQKHKASQTGDAAVSTEAQQQPIEDNPEEVDYNVLHAEGVSRNRSLHEIPPPEASNDGSVYESDSEYTPLLDRDDNGDTRSSGGAFQEFITAIRPIELATWKENRWYLKVYLIIRAPVFLFMTMVVPVVCFNEDKELWNRHLRCLNIAIGIPIALLATNPTAALYLIRDQFPVLAIVSIASIAAAVIVYLVTVNEESPRFHFVLAFLGFILSVIWIQTIASEVVNLLSSLGIVMNLSTTLLGITFLAWGNSIGDFITDVSVARQNLPRIGISACYGGPFFNIMMGVGIPFVMKTSSDGDVQIEFTDVQICLVTSLFIVLVSALVIVPAMGFQFTRKFGFLMYFYYAVFFVIAILTETGVIKLLPG